MNRLTTLKLLAVFTVITALSASLWVAFAFSASKAVGSGKVLGASTEPITTADTIPALLPYPTKLTDSKPVVRSKAYALYNPDSGMLLEGNNENEPVPIASTTKLMTAYIIDHIGNPQDMVTITRDSAIQPVGSSLMGLHINETISVENLLYGALLVSGNDAAHALAEYGGGLLLNNSSAESEEKVARFVEEMNTTARELFMQNTHYMDPVGYNDEGHSSALDLAKLTAKINERPELTKIIGTSLITLTGMYRYDLRNSNRHVTDYLIPGVIGGKTGYTELAGHCLVTSTTRDGITLIAVILHTSVDTKEASASEARKLIEYGFASYRWN